MDVYRRQIPARAGRALSLLRALGRHVQGRRQLGEPVRGGIGADDARGGAGGRRDRAMRWRRAAEAARFRGAEARTSARGGTGFRAATACEGDGRALEISALDRRDGRVAENGDGKDPPIQAAGIAVTRPCPVPSRSGRGEARSLLPRAAREGQGRGQAGARPFRIKIDDRSLEAAWWGPAPDAAPSIVLLHEGLGCIAMWHDSPRALAQATGFGVFAYSRLGYGRSDPAPLPRPVSYMHDEAALLPRVLDAAGVRRCVLVGHS